VINIGMMLTNGNKQAKLEEKQIKIINIYKIGNKNIKNYFQ
jgi:hypothetical protein